jgi:hypothetical protein
MRTLLIAICILMSALAQAGEIRVASISQYELWGSASVSQKFEFNPELGRAWVLITLSSNDPDGGVSDDQRVKIPGLSFDTTTNSIMLDFEGKLTKCAEYKTVGRSIFRRKELVMSPECKFEGRWRNITYDDGFEMKKTKRYEVFLIVE